MNKVLYKEEQKFGRHWVWLGGLPLTAGSLIFFAIAINKQVIHGEPFGDNPMPDAGLLISGLFTVLVMIGMMLFFYKMKLVLEIRSDGIYYRYPPLINAFRKIAVKEIERIEVRKYNPLKEYGGWGIKTGTRQYGKAYNVSGTTGLQLYLKNGRKILFGTQRKAAIHDAAMKMMNFTETLH
jgi:hypothetical protein